MAKHKKVVLHPVDRDGNIDTGVNLYPETLISCVMDEEGNPINVIDKSELDEAVSEEAHFRAQGDEVLAGALEDESSRATASERGLSESIAAEEIRATGVETGLNNRTSVLEQKATSLEHNLVEEIQTAREEEQEIRVIAEGNATEIEALRQTKQNVIEDLDAIRAGASAGATAVQPAALETALAGKQDVINDLETIRSGATLGATALQSVPSEYITESELSNYHDNTKQDLLVSGDNIKTINGNSLVGSGNVIISTNSTFHNGWVTDGTTADFHQSIILDDTAHAGDSFLGTLYCTDLPASMIQAEAVVSIISDGANGKAVDITLTSVTEPPYRWSYARARVNGSWVTTGWIGFQPEITESSKLAASKISGLANVATSGDYGDLSNRPTIPAAQVNSDWNAVSGVAEILNKPTLAPVATSGVYSDLIGRPALAAVATSGSYTDLINKPTIPSIPDCPTTTDGTYILRATVSSGTVTYEWVVDTLARIGE